MKAKRKSTHPASWKQAMDSMREEISRVLAMEQINTSAINELREAITSLKDVIGELGTNAALQGQALLGIKDVFTREVTQLRDDQTKLSAGQMQITEASGHKEELLQQKLDSRFEKLETRIGSIENKTSRASGYGEGIKYILGFALVGGGGLIVWLLDHVRFG